MHGSPRWAFWRCTASPPFQEAGSKRGALHAATLEAAQTSVDRPSRTAKSHTAHQVTSSKFFLILYA